MRLPSSHTGLAFALVVLLFGGIYAALRSMVHSKREWTSLEVKNIANALDMYRVKHQRLPETLGELVPNDMKEVRNDPWGHPYVYLHGDLFSEPRFIVMSVGKDGVPGTKDDVVAWGLPEASL